MKAYKAFRVDREGRARFLFHGNEGSTLVPLNCWIRAENRYVRDGGGDNYYESGFHACLSEEEMEKWKAQTKHKYVVAVVEVRQFRFKEGAKQDIVLADYLWLWDTEWEKALEKSLGEVLANV